MHSLNDLYANDMYELTVPGLDIISINFIPCGIRGMHKLSITGLKILSVNIHPRDVRESVKVTSESDIPGLNGLGLEFSMNSLNGLKKLS